MKRILKENPNVIIITEYNKEQLSKLNKSTESYIETIKSFGFTIYDSLNHPNRPTTTEELEQKYSTNLKNHIKLI